MNQENSQSVYQNAPNMSMMYMMYTPTFGNGSFQINPLPRRGVKQTGFPTVPYLSLEALIYQQQSSNPLVSPVNVISGQNAGQQTIQGNFSVADNTGNQRVQIGYSPNSF